MGNPDRISVGEGARHDEYARVRPLILEEVNGQANEVIAVPGHQAASFLSGKP